MLLSGMLALLSVSAFGAISLVGSPPNGAQGQPYDYTLTAAGGTMPYTYAVNSGTLPAGLTLTTTGVLSGTPSQPGLYALSIRVTDNLAVSGVSTLSLRIGATNGLSITTTNLPAAVRGAAYDFSFAASGGTAPYSFDLLPSSSPLPTGLSLSSTGHLTGTPTTAGTNKFTIRVTDQSGSSYVVDVSLLVNATALAIDQTSLPGLTAGVAYRQTLTASGGTPPYIFTMESGTLPGGITLSGTGTLAGTASTAGNYPIVIRVTDYANNHTLASFTLVVTGSSGGGPLSISDLVLAPVQTGVAYSQQFLSTGGTAPITFTLTSGSLPAGLSLSTGGTLSGTTAATGNYSITITATDANQQTAQKSFTLTVTNSGTAPSFTTSTLPLASTGVAYNASLSVTGGTAPYTITIVNGSLPAGLTLSSSGAISGTPTASTGSYSFTARALDAAGQSVERRFTISFASGTLSFLGGGLPAAKVGSAYTGTLGAVNGAAPYSFTVIAGTLPTGLTLSSNGNLSGVPRESGVYQVTFRVVDANNETATLTLTLIVTGSGFNFTTTSLPSAALNQPYSATLAGTGGTAPVSFFLTVGSLPAGLSLTNAGILSGTPRVAGAFSFAIQATDASNSSTVAHYTLHVNASGIGLSSTLPGAQVGTIYSAALTASGGTGPYTYRVVEGSLPSGLALSNDGVLSGAPAAAGAYNFTIEVRDNTGATSLFSFPLSVSSATNLSIATAQLPNFVIGAAYNVSILATGGTSPYLFSVASGVLPAGISLSSAGILSGTSTATGTFQFVVRVTDASGSSANANLSLTSASSGGGSGLQFTSTDLTTIRVGQPYSVPLQVSGGVGPYRFSVVNGALPVGITLSRDGILSGTATTAGNTTVTIQVIDDIGARVSAPISLNVSSSTLAFSQPSFLAGRVGELYSQSLVATGGSAPYTYSLVSGALPPGVALSSSGTLSGTPTASGSFPVVLRVTDAAGVSYQQIFTVPVGAASLAFTNITLYPSYVGQPYYTSLQAAGGVPPYSFALTSGSLPAGLSLNANGVISGTPTTAGPVSAVTFKVTDATGATANTTIEFAATTQSSLILNFSSVPSATSGQFYLFTPSASGGTAPYTFSVTSPLPLGLFLTPVGNIAGTPTQPGSYNLTIRAQDSTGAIVLANYPFTVTAGGFQFGTGPIPVANLNQPYLYNLTTTGGSGAVTYQLVSGTLPPGLTLSNGVISGTPTATGNYNVVLRATDATGASTSSTLTFTVGGGALGFTSLNLLPGTVNSPYSQNVTATGGTGPYTYQVQSGSLPAGLTLSPAGLLSGTPTATGRFPVTIRVTDAAAHSFDQSFELSIGVAGAPTLNAVASAANYATNGVVPGEAVVLFGANAGPTTPANFTAVNGVVPSTLQGVRVFFDDTPAPILYASADQITAMVPWSIGGRSTVAIRIEYNGTVSNRYLANVLVASPALFTANASGSGPGSIGNQDGTVNTASNAAMRGSIVSLYITGAGAMTPVHASGMIATGTTSMLNQALAVTINGLAATVQYAGNSPGLVEGIVQVNVKLPTGTKTGANNIVINSGAASTTTTVTVYVQ